MGVTLAAAVKIRSLLPQTVSMLMWFAMGVMLAVGSQDQKLLATDCEHTSMAHNGCDVCCCSQDERLLASHQPVPCRIGTDDATGSMRRLYSRRCRDRPGVSIPALAIPRDGSKPEPVLIYFGIIDFLQVGPLY